MEQGSSSSMQQLEESWEEFGCGDWRIRNLRLEIPFGGVVSYDQIHQLQSSLQENNDIEMKNRNGHFCF